MKMTCLGLVVLGSVLVNPLVSLAQESWVEVTTNGVGDRFLVNPDSIQNRTGFVWYWEYRDFRQPNDAFVTTTLDQPVYGVLLQRSVDCSAGVTRLRRMIVHTRGRQVIYRQDYGDNGQLSQPAAGSSAAAVVRYVCDHQSASASQ
jgi:hypothetical protein